jgi:FKBP-type peptidyl-prolyl cis-trans isomerase
MLFKRLRKKKRPDSSGFKWAAIAILIYAVITKPTIEPSLSTPEGTTEQTAQAVPVSVAESLKESLSTSLGWDQVAGSLLPKTVPTLRVEESIHIPGSPAVCGQRVKITYSVTDYKGAPLPDSREAADPLIFTIGGKSVMPALEDGVVGMSLGSERLIHAPFHMAYGAPGFTRPDIAPETNATFRVKLLEASPKLPDSSGFRVMSGTQSDGELLRCGDIARLHVDISTPEGKELYSSRKEGSAPVQFTIGQSEIFLGLEQGALGLTYGGKRTLLVPSNLQSTLKGNAPAVDFSLPKNQTVLVDIEALP